MAKFIIPPRPGQPILPTNFVANYPSNRLFIKKSNTPSRKIHNPTTTPIAPIPNHLFHITRKQFELVKSIHHLQYIENNLPKTWQNWGSNINSSVRLAFSTDETLRMVQTVTSNYLQELRAVSINHYQKVIADATSYLCQHSNEFDFGDEHSYWR